MIRIKDEVPVRVVFVPKTQLTPRVIAIEPSHMQYTQQSVKDYAYKVLETHCLTKNSIRFTRQDFNQSLAHQGSIDKRTSTLDLKDASDRVHLHLVQRIFKNSGLLEYLEDARSLHALLPDGRNIVLYKYASMGSALCFPVEAMVFYTLVQCAMHLLDSRRPSSRSIRSYSRKIAIYGDDIIVPVEYTDVVVSFLESFALKVNVNKSFSKGNFRESCGADYFKGVAVNPVYARRVPHDDSRDWGPSEVMSWVATSDLFYRRGMWVVAEAIRSMVTRVVRRTIPKARVYGPGVAFFSYLFTTDLRFDRDLQCWKQKRLVYQPSKKKDDIHGNALACLNSWGIHQHMRNKRGGICNSSVSAGSVDNASNRFRGLEDLQYSYSRVDECGDESPNWRAIRGYGYRCTFSGSRPLSYEENLYPHATGRRTLSVRLVPKPLVPECEVFRLQEDTCLTVVESDPLLHLFGDNFGINFDTSVKRGCFKSKSRWVSLAG
jgi:hypothetical protein